MNKETLKLNDQEQRILRDISFARSKVLGSGDDEDITVLSMYAELLEPDVRQVLAVFDFFRCVYTENTGGLKHHMAVLQNKDPHEGTRLFELIRDYHAIMEAQMQDRYTPEDISRLQKRMKGYLKEQKSPPSRTLYIADCHFYHERLCHEMDCRGFSGFEEMNEHMIRQWNTKVTEKDTVYILGDLSLVGGFQTSGILKCLNGKKHLIIGNHDDRYLGDKFFETHRLSSVQPYAEIRDKGRNVILSHYPIFCYKRQYHRDKQGNLLTYMLYGHVHNSHDEALINRFIMETKETKVMSRNMSEPEPIPCNMINCFCMFSNYQPMTLDEWIVIDKKRRKEMEKLVIHSPNTRTSQ